MTELKTLKDLEAENSNKKPEKTMWICSVRLRQEAIKWIKKARELKDKDVDINNPNIWDGKFVMCPDCFEEDWINHFFNITEKDLK